jgi:hypothetical protein
MNEDYSPAKKFARQKRTAMWLGIGLIIAGAVVLFALRRLALPLRIMAGLGDVFMGCVLIVMVWQQGGGRTRPPSGPDQHRP